jgi:hypothetical protein
MSGISSPGLYVVSVTRMFAFAKEQIDSLIAVKMLRCVNVFINGLNNMTVSHLVLMAVKLSCA